MNVAATCLVSALTVSGIVVAGDADAAGTAKVRIVDHYHHGRVDASNYFNAGHTYRVVIYDGSKCDVVGGRTVPGPFFRIVKTG